MSNKSNQHRRQRQINNTLTPISYEQALIKAMETLWDPESVKQTKELAEKIRSNSLVKATTCVNNADATKRLIGRA